MEAIPPALPSRSPSAEDSKMLQRSADEFTSSPTQEEEQQRRGNEGDYVRSSAYKLNWSQVILGATSGLMLCMVFAVLYSLYLLCIPYWDSIAFGILLSVVFHPQSSEQYSGSRRAQRRCAEKMKRMQQSWASQSTLYGIVGSLLSLRYFFTYALMRGVIFLGLNKLSFRVPWKSTSKDPAAVEKQNVTEKNEFLLSTDEGRTILRVLAAVIFTIVAHSAIGFLFFFELHAILLVLFAITVVILSQETFVTSMWNVWRVAVVLFFVVALSYNVALDVLSISDAVKRTTAVVVNARQKWSSEGVMYSLDPNISTLQNAGRDMTQVTSSPSEIEEMIVMKVQETVVNELSKILNHTNATELAVAVRQVIGSMLATSPSEISVNMLKEKTGELYASLFQSGGPLIQVDWFSVLQNSLQRLKPFFVFFLQIVFGFASNMIGFFDTVYAIVLFLCILRYFMQLEHTFLYYGIAKMLKVLDTHDGEKHARIIEREITVSFLTLLQSFWHISWFHFCITFCLFRSLSFPVPFFAGIISSFTAVFPLTPKWLSPVAFAFAHAALGAFRSGGPIGVVVDQCVWWCLLAFTASYADEWLLCVSRGLRGSSVRDASGVKREQLPTFVIGTTLVLGYVCYGVRGILLGPMTVIVAKVMFDNWDIVSGHDRETNAGKHMDEKKS